MWKQPRGIPERRILLVSQKKNAFNSSNYNFGADVCFLARAARLPLTECTFSGLRHESASEAISLRDYPTVQVEY